MLAMRRFTFWAVGLAVLVIVVVNVQGWLVLSRTSRAFEDELGQRLQAVAVTLGRSVGPGHAGPEAGRLLRSVLVTLADPALVGQVDPALELDLTEVLSAFAGVPTQSRLYRSGGVFLKTAFVGLADEDGIVEAVLGVEADARFFSVLTAFRNSLLLVNVVSLLAIAAIVLVSVSLARHALRVEQAASRANTLALMGQMAAQVAHEVKNPLAIIRSTAELLKKRHGGERPDPEFDYIQEEVDRLSRSVSNYLGVGASRPAEPEPVDVGALAREVVADLSLSARKQGVELSVTGGEVPPVPGNRAGLRQVLLNLVLNGIQCQPGGGRVEVSVEVESGDVRVRVQDQGPGIDPKDARMVFEPFFTTRDKGSGLGLFVVRRVVEEHGGRVGLDSRPGSGTTFTMRLPK
jgi:signal transduction histidine kinase